MKRMGRYLGWLWVAGVVGAIAELVLTAHTETPWQWTPLVVMGVAMAAYAWRLAGGGTISEKALRVAMLMLVAAGLAGIVLHMRGKMEFKAESDPSLKGIGLMWASLGSKSPPALAPGALVQLGLLGLIWLRVESMKESSNP